MSQRLETVVMQVIRLHVGDDAPEKAKENAFVGHWSFVMLMNMAGDFCTYVAKHLGLSVLSISNSYGEQENRDTIQHCYLSTCVFALNGVRTEKIKAFLDRDEVWRPYTQFDEGLFTVHLAEGGRKGFIYELEQC